MNAPLDELYLSWLYQQVASVKLKNPSRSYWELIKQLYTKEFVWLIPNDDNRVADGKDLRKEFLVEERLTGVDPEWMELECSVLEMLITLSRWLTFEADDGEPREWFWHLIANLGLPADECNDRVYNDHIKENIDSILDRFIWRNYSPSGQGGLFPLQHPSRDQRRVEIWYQLNAYLLEA